MLHKKQSQPVKQDPGAAGAAVAQLSLVSMDFGAALHMMRNGKSMRRQCWALKSDGLFIGSISQKIMWVRGGHYIPSTEDLVAEDWVEYFAAAKASTAQGNDDGHAEPGDSHAGMDEETAPQTEPSKPDPVLVDLLLFLHDRRRQVTTTKANEVRRMTYFEVILQIQLLTLQHHGE